MSSYKRKLRDLSGNYVFPATRSTCVYLDDNQTLQEWIDSQSDSSGIDILDVYPVGSVYVNDRNTSPAALFGGTWSRITPPASSNPILLMGAPYDANATKMYKGVSINNKTTLMDIRAFVRPSDDYSRRFITTGEAIPSTGKPTYYIGSSSSGLTNPMAINDSIGGITAGSIKELDFTPYSYTLNFWRRIS